MFRGKLTSSVANNALDPNRSNFRALFKDEIYREDGGGSTFADAITHSASTNATMTSGYGPELVTNGGFDTDTSGWTAATGITLTQSSAGMNVAHDGGTYYIGGYQTITTVVGKSYIITFDVTATNGSNGRLRCETTLGAGNLLNVTMGLGSHEYIFQATTTTSVLNFALQSNVTGSVTYDNISVREMPAIKWRPHNLLTYSEEFAGGWSPTAFSVTFPGGSEVRETTTTGSHLAQLNGALTPVGQLTAEVEVAGIDRDYIRMGTLGGGTSVVFRLSTQTVHSAGASLAASVTALGDGYYNCKMTWVQSLANTFFVGMADDSGNTSYTGDVAKGAFFRKKWLYRSDLGGMVDNPDRGDSYVPTTSSAVYLPRRGHHIYNGSAWVNEGMLHESEARTNLEPYSKIDSGWTTAGLASLTADAAISPTGVQDATEIIENAAGGSHNVYRFNSFTTSNVDNTFSAYVKRGSGSRHVQLRAHYLGATAPYVNFDLENGVVGTTSGASGTSANGHTWTLSNTNIENVGNGWYRISATVNASTGFSFGFYMTDSTAAYEAYGYTGDGTSSLYIWNAQTEEASTPSSPIPTSGATVTRAAESLTIPAANLPWPTPNVIGSELVTNPASQFTVNGTGTWSDNGNGTYTFTDTVGGQVRPGVIFDLPDETRVYQVRANIVSTVDVPSIQLAFFAGGSTVFKSSGSFDEIGPVVTGNRSIRFGIESASTILGANFTLSDISIREVDPLSVSIQMKGRMTYADTGSTGLGSSLGGEATFARWAFGSNNNYITLGLNTGNVAVGQIRFAQETENLYNEVTSAFTTYSPGVFVPFNIASRHGSTFVNGAVDGVALTAVTTPTALPDLSATDLNLGYDFMGTIGGFQVWNKDIGNDIVTTTEPSLEPSLHLSFEGTASSFTVTDWSE